MTTAEAVERLRSIAKLRAVEVDAGALGVEVFELAPLVVQHLEDLEAKLRLARFALGGIPAKSRPL